MKLVLGFLVGAAIGFGGAVLLSARRNQQVDERVLRAGDDSTPSPLPQQDGMAAPTPAPGV